MEDGLDLGSAFSAAGHGFPSDEIAADLEVFGASADFVDRLTLIAAETLEETVWRLEQMARRAETGAKLAGGLMAGWMLFGIFSLYEQLGHGFRGLGMSLGF